jgi:polar amino acid transport system substrate-binding protein
MDHTLPRRLLPVFGAGAATVAALGGIRGAVAQPAATSTWDQIMQTTRLRVGAALTEPFYFRDNTNSQAPGAVRVGDVVWRGLGPRLGEAIARAMNVQLEMVEVTWGTAVAALQANQIDTMFILDATPERALAVDFVPTPALWYPISALVKNDFRPQTWAECNDPAVRVGVTLGSSTDQTLTRLSPRANIQRFQQAGEMFAAWQANRIEAAFTTGPTADLAIARLRTGQNRIIRPVVAVPGGAAVRKEQDQRWASYLNTCVAYYYNAGITQTFYEEYMTFRGLEPGKATSIQRENW